MIKKRGESCLLYTSIEMGEILYLADNIRDGDAEEVLKCLSKRTGAVKANGTTMQYMAKIYMATKEVIKKYSRCV